ncbi:hypothetical protein [Macrococcus capreoli]|uniref:hypothetical protein n=1 Tax=Macrococcus capreoli TaxID=2982690 RepID=UPI003EE67508
MSNSDEFIREEKLKKIEGLIKQAYGIAETCKDINIFILASAPENKSIVYSLCSDNFIANALLDESICKMFHRGLSIASAHEVLKGVKKEDTDHE